MQVQPQVLSGVQNKILSPLWKGKHLPSIPLNRSCLLLRDLPAQAGKSGQPLLGEDLPSFLRLGLQVLSHATTLVLDRFDCLGTDT